MTKNSKSNQALIALWKGTSKNGGAYFTGKGVVGFYNSKKQNPKEPDMRVYAVDAEGNRAKDSMLSLWVNVSKKGNKFLTGKFLDKKVVGFINAEASVENKQPYIRIYESTKLDAAKQEEIKEAKEADDLPF